MPKFLIGMTGPPLVVQKRMKRRNRFHRSRFARRARLSCAIQCALLALAMTDPAPALAQVAAASPQYWDGNETAADGDAEGGDGTWSAATNRTNWTSLNGTTNARWVAGNIAVFSGLPGYVTVDTGAGVVNFGGAQFNVDGYVLTGGVLTTTTASTPLSVGEGMVATIAAPLAGSGGLQKTGPGTLRLTGANTYSGLTQVLAGTLQVPAASALGNGTGLLTLNGNGGNVARLLFSADATLARRTNAASNSTDVIEAAPGTTLMLSAPAFSGAGGAVTVSSGASLEVRGDLRVTGNGATSHGGAFYSTGTLAFAPGKQGLWLTGNSAVGTGSGGAVYASNTRSVSITGDGGALDISGNTGSQGGAIYAGSVSIDGAFSAINLSGNTGRYATAMGSSIILSRGGGGALYAYEKVLLRNSGTAAPLTISGNISGSDGGAVLAHHGMTISGNYTDILVEGNSTQVSTASRGMGGALRVSDGAMVIDTETSGSLIARNNTAASFGGFLDGAYLNSTFSLLGSYGAITLTGNRSVVDGGGAIGVGNDMLIDTRTAGAFDAIGNQSATSGGALLGYYEDLTLSGTYGSVRFENNVVASAISSGPGGGWGGAVFSAKAVLLSPVVAGELVFVNNRAGGNGGAVASGTAGSVTLGGASSRLVLDGNTAASGTTGAGLGGAIYTPGRLAISGDHQALQITNNSARVQGGAFYAGNGFSLAMAPGATLASSGNRAGTAGGFLYAASGSVAFDLGTNAVADIGNAGSAAAGTDGIAGAAGVQLVKWGQGTLNVWGANTYAGGTRVEAGTLRVNGSNNSAVTVLADATLGGTGTISGPVSILGDGHLAPGASAGTLTVGSLTLAPTAQLDYELGPAGTVGSGVNDLVNVGGSLVLDGSLNVHGLDGFGSGVYRLIDYGGAFTNNNLDIGSVPGGFVATDFVVQTGVAGQVNLMVQAGGYVNRFWDGGNTVANRAVDGGNGTWNTSATNWTGVDGVLQGSWAPDAFAIFQGTAGNVTLDEAVDVGGMQFASDGYSVSAGSGSLRAGTDFVVRTDAGTTATIAATIADGAASAVLRKTDAGTLVLSGTNTYSGGTRVEGGTLQVAADANLGGDGGITLDSGTLRTSSSFGSARAITLDTNGGALDVDAGTTLTWNGLLVGAGDLTKLGDGTLVLGATNTYAGATTVSAGTLAIASDDSLGDPGGSLRLDAATLRADASFSLSAARNLLLGAGNGTIDTQAFTLVASHGLDGPGGLAKLGTGTLVLAGDGSYLGSTAVLAGTLQIGSGGTTGSVPGNIFNQGTVVFERADTLGYDGIITGAGQLVQQGPGTLVLTADHHYTGGTSILAGALQLGDGGATGSVIGDILDNGVLVFAHDNTYFHDGLISGSGTLVQKGPGTLVLTSDHGYTGGTTIAAGTLQLGNGGTTGSVFGDIVDQGVLAFDRADDTSYSGTVSGAGALVQQGDGTLVLTADHAYTGGTLISAGVLQLGDGGTTGSILGDVIDDAQLIFDRADVVTFGGRISGVGSMLQQGTGTVVFSADHGYTGGTTISQGTLQLGNGGRSGSVAGDIVDNGKLVFDRADVLTYGGVISGSGSVLQQGTGTVVFSADHSYTGGTTISSGALQLGNGGTTGSVRGDIVADGLLVFDRSADLVYPGQISGVGSMRKQGSSTLWMTGTSSYTGPTWVNAGRLQADGSLLSTVLVAQGAVLGGHGTVGGIANEGTVAPGASIGRLTVTGNYVQGASGVVQIEFDDSGHFDELNVAGSASLGGEVDYVPNRLGVFASDLLYTYLPAAGGVEGRFATPTQTEFAGATLTTIYNPGSVQLEITSRSLDDNVDPVDTRSILDCVGSLQRDRVGAVGDRARVLGAMVWQLPDDFVDSVISACPRDVSALAQAYRSAASSRMARLDERLSRFHAAADPLSDIYRLREPGTGLWVSGGSADGDADRHDRARPGYRWHGWDFTVGVDHAIGESGLAGAYLARTDQDQRFAGDVGVGSTRMAGWAGALYGSYRWDSHWFVAGAYEHSWHDLSGRREIRIAELQRIAAADRNGTGQTLSATVGYSFSMGKRTLLQPILLLRRQRFSDDAYAEQGAGALDLSYGRATSNATRGELGLSVRHLFASSSGLPVLRAHAFYLDDRPDSDSRAARFEDGTPFTVTADVGSQRGVRYGLDFSHTWRSNTSYSLAVDAADYGNINEVTASATLQIVF